MGAKPKAPASPELFPTAHTSWESNLHLHYYLETGGLRAVYDSVGHTWAFPGHLPLLGAVVDVPDFGELQRVESLTQYHTRAARTYAL